MNLKRRKASSAIAALLLFSILQVGLQVGFAERNTTKTETLIVQQIVARLVTRNNQPITINGQSAGTGASIISGATLETGADQSATVNVGPLGSVDISPNTKVVLTFAQGNLKALVIHGCVILTARQNTTGEIATEQTSVGKTDPATGGVLEMCLPQGAAAPVVGSGVAAGAGAGAGAPAGAATAAAGGHFGLGVPATIALVIAGPAAGLTPLFFDGAEDNPSPSAP
ncbi:MAG TPA: hypothetical protein VK893_06690 [Pyrinomonadaceae bacterium]|nr:hypothetical protein [Pyrinomonadaceae bacterium]